MAEMRAKHAFGDLANVQAALDKKVIDAYDILFLKDGDRALVGWIDKDGNIVLAENSGGSSEGKREVIVSEALPESGQEQGVIYIETTTNTGSIWNGAEWVKLFENMDAIASEIQSKLDAKADKADTLAGYGITDAYTKKEADLLRKEMLDSIYMYIAKNDLFKDKYEVFSKPAGTLVDYREKEIRVMCPADTKWELQQVNAAGDKNTYYIGLKMYAPDSSVVGFKTDLKETIEDDTMHSFEGNEFAGIDDYGRKYNIAWLPAAKYDEASQAWTYSGVKSTVDKFVGWPMSIEWYDADNKLVGTDTYHINLTNESCHTSIDPFYVRDAVAESKEYADEQIAKAGGFGGIEIVEF